MGGRGKGRVRVFRGGGDVILNIVGAKLLS